MISEGTMGMPAAILRPAISTAVVWIARTHDAHLHICFLIIRISFRLFIRRIVVKIPFDDLFRSQGGR